MTDAEWEASTDPATMFAALPVLMRCDNEQVGSGISDRKLRLWACACARWLGTSLSPIVRETIEFTEHLADGNPLSWEMDPEGHAAWTSTPQGLDAMIRSLLTHQQARTVQAALLRDVVGNPFHRPTLCGAAAKVAPWAAHCPECAALRTPTVQALAEAAYQEQGRRCPECNGRGRRVVSCTFSGGTMDSYSCHSCHGTGRRENGTLDPERLLVLADALEEAGADCAAILEHLRGRGPHCRGCAVLDLLTGRD